eukprot:SAG11_NODE_246_length_11683_cov_15.540142_8_plen_71_part_00
MVYDTLVSIIIPRLTRMKLVTYRIAAAVLKACRANGETTFIAPANAINVEQEEPVAESEDDTTEDLNALD